nr:hypothetical protein [Tanacetum cinerariifolium]
LDSAGGLDSTGGLDSAGGVDSAGGLTSAGISVAAGPTVPVEPSSPLRDPSKGKAVASPSSPVTALTAKELADQQATILEAERQELLEVAEERDIEIMASAAQSTHRQDELDRVALNLTNEEWTGLVDQVRANPTLSAELLGADVSEDTFSVRMVELMNRRRKAIAEMKAKAKRKKPMTPAQQKEFMRTFVKNQSSDVRGLTDDQLRIIYDKIRRAVDLATAKDHHQHLKRSGEPLVLDSPPKDTSLPLDPETEEQHAPLRKSSRKKSITRKKTLPSPSKPTSDALPFDEDDPEAEFKRYLRQASDDDEPAEPVSLALVSDITTWEIIPIEFGRGRADLMVLYGLVSDKYKIERATKTEAGDIMYMFVDKKYPLTPETIQRMLNHGLEIDRDPFGNDLTTAIQLI